MLPSSVFIFIIIVAVVCVESATTGNSNTDVDAVRRARCPGGWVHHRPDDSCYIYMGSRDGSMRYPRDPIQFDYPFTAYSPTPLTFPRAVDKCAELDPSAGLVEPVSRNHTNFLLSLIPVGGSSWLDVRATHTDNEWVSGRGRPSRYFLWDEANGHPVTHASTCVALTRRGTPRTHGGGNNGMVTVHCGVPLAFLCRRPRVAPHVGSVNGHVVAHGQGGVVVRAILGAPFMLSLEGIRIPLETYVSLQTTTEESHPTAPGLPVPCSDVRLVSGVVAQPRLVAVAAARTTAFGAHCNGTCATGNVTIPADTPWYVGARYSVCYAVGESASGTPQEYYHETGAVIEVVHRTAHILREDCKRRQGIAAHAILFGTDAEGRV
eukprot:PhM_4_TR14058/c0_g1_i1/m.57316